MLRTCRNCGKVREKREQQIRITGESMIETKRLQIKPFCMDDIDIIYRLYSDEEILRYTPYDRMTKEDAVKHTEKVVEDWEAVPLADLEMLVSLKQDGRKIGRCGIHVSDRGAMIGWFLIQEVWNQGFATEITEALIEYCRDILKVGRIYALCNPENTASCRVLEKCGMQKVGDFKNKCKYTKNGIVTYEDEREYVLLY